MPLRGIEYKKEWKNGLGLHYKNEEQIFQEQYYRTNIPEYPMFRETGIVKHGFSMLR